MSVQAKRTDKKNISYSPNLTIPNMKKGTNLCYSSGAKQYTIVFVCWVSLVTDNKA